MQKLLILVANDASVGSIDEQMVPQNPPLTRNSVIEAMINTVDSCRTSVRALSNEAIESQSTIWAVFMTSREAMLRPVILRRTFASPMIVKSWLTDISL